MRIVGRRFGLLMIVVNHRLVVFGVSRRLGS
jgi:hypothetical protein